MTPQEMILTLRICGNHPKYDDFSCGDCPWKENCERDGGGADLSLRAADIIEKLLRQNELLMKPKWIRPEERLPVPYEPVIVARVYEKDGPLKVEQGMLTQNDWWKVYGTNVKKIEYWMPMPAAPKE